MREGTEKYGNQRKQTKKRQLSQGQNAIAAAFSLISAIANVSTRRAIAGRDSVDDFPVNDHPKKRLISLLNLLKLLHLETRLARSTLDVGMLVVKETLAQKPQAIASRNANC